MLKDVINSLVLTRAGNGPGLLKKGTLFGLDSA